MHKIKEKPLSEVRKETNKQQLEQNISELEIDLIEQEQEMSDMDIRIYELEQKVGE